MKTQAVRGMQDIFYPDTDLFRFINQVTFEVVSLYGCREIVTPIMELTEVFSRTLGESSDIVHKEMYSFTDRGGDSITLRPEGTAGIARSFISEGLTQDLPLKFYYFGPMFRYERPQKGRYRQFHQLGVEMLGFDSFASDVECILLARDVLKRLGLLADVRLEMNTLGAPEDRAKYRESLQAYFMSRKNDLSEISQIRLETNPLRILDSKDKKDQEIVQEAPVLGDFLSPESRDFFTGVQNLLARSGVEFHLNSRLVRGLDYYSHTVFEFVTDRLGSQGAVLAGGRYDALIEQMGGPKTRAVGWASGVERLMLLLKETGLDQVLLKEFAKGLPNLAVISLDEQSLWHGCLVSEALRSFGFQTDTIFQGNFSKKLKKADRLGAQYVFIVGQSEVEKGLIAVKNLKSGLQKSLQLKGGGDLWSLAGVRAVLAEVQRDLASAQF